MANQTINREKGFMILSIVLAIACFVMMITAARMAVQLQGYKLAVNESIYLMGFGIGEAVYCAEVNNMSYNQLVNDYAVYYLQRELNKSNDGQE